MDSFWQALTLDFSWNATLVALGTGAFGACAGVLGVFLLLRQSTLLGDALAHATLPGVALGFVFSYSLGSEGRNLAVIVAGAVISATFANLVFHLLIRQVKIPRDAAMAAVLSGFYAFGIVALNAVQQLPTAGQAGLESFFFGQSATLNLSEFLLILGAGGGVLAGVLIGMRTFVYTSFDAEFSHVQGVNPQRADRALTALLVVTLSVGLVAVGFILVIALLTIPALIARMNARSVGWMMMHAVFWGFVVNYVSAAVSASVPHTPVSALAVVLATGVFIVSWMMRGRA